MKIANYNLAQQRVNSILPKEATKSSVSFGRNYIKLYNQKLKLNIIEKALERMEKHSRNNTPLIFADNTWLHKLRRYFGTNSITVNNPDNPTTMLNLDSKITIKKINKDGGQAFTNALKIMLAATKYKPSKVPNICQ